MGTQRSPIVPFLCPHQMFVAILLNARHGVQVQVCDGEWYMKTLMRDMQLPAIEEWWDFLSNFDCIIGGFDFSVNYWYVYLQASK